MAAWTPRKRIGPKLQPQQLTASGQKVDFQSADVSNNDILQWIPATIASGVATDLWYEAEFLRVTGMEVQDVYRMLQKISDGVDALNQAGARQVEINKTVAGLATLMYGTEATKGLRERVYAVEITVFWLSRVGAAVFTACAIVGVVAIGKALVSIIAK